MRRYRERPRHAVLSFLAALGRVAGEHQAVEGYLVELVTLLAYRNPDPDGTS